MDNHVSPSDNNLLLNYFAELFVLFYNISPSLSKKIKRYTL